MFLEKSKKQFKKWYFLQTRRVKPCSEEEVQLIEQKLGLTFPEAYREFLLWMGHGAGSFLRGMDIFYQHILDIQEWAVELLAENNFPMSLPDDALVFMMDQGYRFMFLLTSEGEDPPVYYYNESIHKESFEAYFRNLDEFLVTHMEHEAR